MFEWSILDVGATENRFQASQPEIQFMDNPPVNLAPSATVTLWSSPELDRAVLDARDIVTESQGSAPQPTIQRIPMGRLKGKQLKHLPGLRVGNGCLRAMIFVRPSFSWRTPLRQSSFSG